MRNNSAINQIPHVVKVDCDPVTKSPETMPADEEFSNADFFRWHGMSSVIEEIKVAINVSKTKGAKVNGWAILCTVCGTDEVLRRLSENLNLVVLVCGLLIGTSLSWATDLPGQFDGKEKTNVSTCYIIFAVVAIAMHFFCIILSIQFLQAVNTCARDCDKWRLVLTMDWIPSLIYMIFIIGNFSVALTVGFAMIFNYGEVSGYSTAVGLTVVCGLFLNWFNRRYFLKTAHVVRGWYENGISDYDIFMPFSEIEKLAKYDQRRNLQKLPASNDLMK